jgi:hypothetical protein
MSAAGLDSHRGGIIRLEYKLVPLPAFDPNGRKMIGDAIKLLPG